MKSWWWHKLLESIKCQEKRRLIIITIQWIILFYVSIRWKPCAIAIVKIEKNSFLSIWLFFTILYIIITYLLLFIWIKMKVSKWLEISVSELFESFGWITKNAIGLCYKLKGFGWLFNIIYGNRFWLIL